MELDQQQLKVESMNTPAACHRSNDLPRRDQHLKKWLFPTLGLQRTCETVYIHMLSQHHTCSSETPKLRHMMDSGR